MVFQNNKLSDLRSLLRGCLPSVRRNLHKIRSSIVFDYAEPGSVVHLDNGMDLDLSVLEMGWGCLFSDSLYRCLLLRSR